MNRHIRILVAVLFAILILLAAAIVVFYLDVSKDSEELPSSHADASGSAEAGSKSQIIQGENELYGLADEDGNIILDPEWKHLQEIGNRCYLAEMQLQTQKLCGIVNSEGDIIVPCVYEEIWELTNFLYAGKTAADEKILLYDADFRLLLPEAWDSCQLVDETLHVCKDADTYRYGLGASLELVAAELPRRSRPISFSMDLTDKELLSHFTQAQWSQAADLLLSYLDCYRRQKPELLEALTDAEHQKALTKSLRFLDGTWDGSGLDTLSLEVVQQDGAAVLQVQTDLELSRAVQPEEAMDPEKETTVRLTLSMMVGADGQLYLTEAVFDGQDA